MGWFLVRGSDMSGAVAAASVACLVFGVWYDVQFSPVARSPLHCNSDDGEICL